MDNNKSTIKYADFVPDKKWKQWTVDNLPASDCNWITDIDSFIRSRNGCIALVEIKRQGVKVPTWQKMSYGLIAAALEAAVGKELKTKYLPHPITIKCFKGIYELIFEKSWFDDGKTFLTVDGNEPVEVTEAELKQILSFEKTEYCYPAFCNCHK